MHLSIYRNIILNHLFRIKNLSSTKIKNHNIRKLLYDVLIHRYKKDSYILLFLTNSWFIDLIKERGQKQDDWVVVDTILRRLSGVIWIGWRDG